MAMSSLYYLLATLISQEKTILQLWASTIYCCLVFHHDHAWRSKFDKHIFISSLFQCIQVENEYVRIHEELRKIRVPFARADVDAVKELAAQHSTDLPALVFYRKKKAIPYSGVHSVAPVMAYTSKLLSSPLQTLSSVDDAISFMQLGSGANYSKYSLSTVFVVRTQHMLHCIYHTHMFRSDSSVNMTESRKMTTTTIWKPPSSCRFWDFKTELF